MDVIKFKINDKVEVIYNEEVYACDVQDINDKYFAISVPIKEREYLALQKGERIDVYYYDEKSIYEFTTVVVGREKKNIPIIWLAIPQRYKKIQRRKFVRVFSLFKVKYATIKKNMLINKESLDNLKFVDAIALDLSGGGIRLRIKEDLKKKQDLIISIPMKNEDMLVKGQIVRINKEDSKTIIYGVKFIEISVREQDKIIEHVFKIMREQMKKGLREE